MHRYKSYFNEDIAITETSEFKKWFGNSKVVKGDKPLVVYHGGNRKFDTFSYKYMGDTDDLFLGAGFYFSSSKKIAKGYGSKIIECYLSIKNPLIIKDSYSFGGVHPDKIKEILGLSLKATPKNIWDELKKQGYDGVIVNSGSNKMVEIVALKPNQIKSATNNNGEFSLQSNNIYESQFKEDIIIPLNKGDSFFYGKFKNKSAIYDSHYFTTKGDLVVVTDSGKEIPMAKIRLLTEKKFSENLRFSDLMKKVSMSPFTLDYNKETNKLMGPPTTHIKLKSMRVNKKKDYVIFVWKTKRTPKYDNKKMMAVDPKNNFNLKPAKFYTIEIKVLDFFKLLKTKPDNNFTNKDIEEVFNVADVQVWSSVPAYQYQGMNYNMTLFDASIYPENRPPDTWNELESKYGKTHNGYQLLDKHSAGLINSIKFYIPQMRMMLKKYLGLTKK